MEITNVAVQTVTAGNSLVFNETVITGSCSIVHRTGSGLVTLRGLTSGCCSRARFRVTFGGNIAIPDATTVGPISLAIALDSEPVASTTMTITPADVEEYGNVSSSIFIDIPSTTSSQVSVKNVSDIPVLVQNANLIIERVA